MAVAHDASSKSTWSNNTNSFSWTHTPTGGASGTPEGALVYVVTDANADYITSVTYGGVAMTQVVGGEAADTAGEPGRCTAFFLGQAVPTGIQTITVTRTNNVTYMMGMCATQTASAPLIVVDVTLLEGEGALTEQSVDDGSPGSSSLRYAGLYWGDHTGSFAAGTNSVALQGLGDALPSAYGGLVREGAAGQGNRPVGFNSSGATDDRAAVHLAVVEQEITYGEAALGLVVNRTAAANTKQYGQVVRNQTISIVPRYGIAASRDEVINFGVTGKSTRKGLVSLGLSATPAVHTEFRPLPNPWKNIPYVGDVIDKMQEALALMTLPDPLRHTGIGDPEGVVSAPPGAMYINLAGGANTTMYIKETGTGNTGWAAK